MARLEQLLDEHAQVAALDPSKLPAIRKKVWELLVSAELHQDLGCGDAPGRATRSTSSSTTSTGICASSRTPRSAAACTSSARRPPARPASTCCLALTRLPQGAVPSLRQVVADRLGVDPRRGCRPGRSRRGGSRVPAPARGRAPRPPGPAGEAAGAGLGRRQVLGAGPRPHPRRDRRGAGRPGRPVGAARAERGAHPGHGPRAADRAQLLLGRPQGPAEPAGVGGRPGPGRPAAGRHLADEGRYPAAWAWSCGGPRPCAPAATTWPGPGPARACARSGRPSPGG